MHAGTQPAHNKLRSGRSAHQATLTPSTALNQPISRQFTEMQKSFIHQYDQTTAAHFMFLFSLVTRLATTNKSIRALISLICYDYVRQESTVTSLRTTPSAWCTYTACILHTQHIACTLHTQSLLLLRVRGGREGGRAEVRDTRHTQTLVQLHCHQQK